MDLTRGWDFSRECDRQKAREYLETHKTRLLIGSPMCTMFSQLQNLSAWNEHKEARWREDVRHMEFVIQLYRQQMDAGRLFLHEHPAQATSWTLDKVVNLGAVAGVYIVTSDQCMFGLTTHGLRRNDVSRAKKRTKFMTNSYHIAKELDRTCDGAHKHQALVGGRAKAAERYPPALCRAICRGLIKHTTTGSGLACCNRDTGQPSWAQDP